MLFSSVFHSYMTRRTEKVKKQCCCSYANICTKKIYWRPLSLNFSVLYFWLFYNAFLRECDFQAFLPNTVISYLCDFCIVSCISHFYWSWTLRNSTFIFFICPRIIFRTTWHCFLTWGRRSTSSCFALKHSFFSIIFVPIRKASVYLRTQQDICNEYLKFLILVTIFPGK